MLPGTGSAFDIVSSLWAHDRLSCRHPHGRQRGTKRPTAMDFTGGADGPIGHDPIMEVWTQAHIRQVIDFSGAKRCRPDGTSPS